MRFRGCAVWGTKEIPPRDTEKITRRLRGELEHAVCQGFTDFFVGGLSVFSRLAAEQLLELRGQNYPVTVSYTHLKAAINHFGNLMKSALTFLCVNFGI